MQTHLYKFTFHGKGEMTWNTLSFQPNGRVINRAFLLELLVDLRPYCAILLLPTVCGLLLTKTIRLLKSTNRYQLVESYLRYFLLFLYIWGRLMDCLPARQAACATLILFIWKIVRNIFCVLWCIELFSWCPFFLSFLFFCGPLNLGLTPFCFIYNSYQEGVK